MSVWSHKTVLITVRTYPMPAHKGVEVSCTAGVTDDDKWIRLFPVPYRFLGEDRRFKKYQWIELNAREASNDSRPESFHPDIDSIKIISERLPSTSNWQSRKKIIMPLLSHCLCCLKAERDQKGFPTLGLFRPEKITRLVIEQDSAEWTPDELAKLRRHTLFSSTPVTELEKIPYKFKYEFTCPERNCPGHSLSCTDWELGASYRNWIRRYGPAGWESKFMQRYEYEMIHKNDTHFYVGTLHQHPANWIIVGLFYPLLQLEL